MKVKTIDINAKEWFDKANGNSYFSGDVTINYGMKSAKSYKMPFQYGYGQHYVDMAMQLLNKEGVINLVRHDNGSYTSTWQYCKDNNIIFRANMKENCLKRDL
jgi:hypothetical protein